MLQSGGVLVKSPTQLWAGTPAQWGTGLYFTSLELAGKWSSYSQIYREQLWVAVLVNKRAKAEARLPLKVYERGVDGRQEARDHPYAVLLRDPHPRLSAFEFWRWTRSTRDIYGEAIWLKERDKGGRPIALHPIHPTNFTNEEKDGRVVYEVRTSKVDIEGIDQSDVVHFKDYHPDSMLRGLSMLEPLRQTLVGEDASRRATSAFWRNGSRPSVLLSAPSKLSEGAAKRVKVSWDQMYSGPDNWGKTAVLEEGMTPHVLTLSASESQYIETRKLNREEVCAAYDVPPPVVHILDRATFSNITEQMRSMYRDTMAPLLGEDEAVLEKQLRGSVRKGTTEADFGADVYAEFLLDEVLRGAFEDRAAAIQSAVNSGQMTLNEARQLENRPAKPGGDRLYINSTMVPVVEEKTELADKERVEALGALIRAGFEPGPSAAALGLPAIPHTGLVPVTVKPDEELRPLPAQTSRTVMGRLSRQKSLDEVDPDALVAGLNGEAAAVLEQLAAAKEAGEDVAGLRARLQSIGRS